MAYRYNQPVSGGSADVSMTLAAANGTENATFDISDSPLVANATQRLTLDLAENARWPTACTLSVTVDDGSGSPVTRTTDPVVVIDDEPRTFRRCP